MLLSEDMRVCTHETVAASQGGPKSSDRVVGAASDTPQAENEDRCDDLGVPMWKSVYSRAVPIFLFTNTVLYVYANEIPI